MRPEPPLAAKWRRSQKLALQERCLQALIDVGDVLKWVREDVALHGAQSREHRHPLDTSVPIEDVLPRLAERFMPPNLHAKTSMAPRASFADEVRDFFELLRTRRPARELRFDARAFEPAHRGPRVNVSIVYEIDRASYEVQVRLLVDPSPLDDDPLAHGGG